ncbi:MAG: UDP-glucose/GDP-mannose dehydrogenase family protein [Oligoflexales bacterium]|nr:UDP-glucose/GDP-mannose dehydrogenase family protein [Oligoflexales bacterium]
MKITVIGAGYVGLPSALVFAEYGNQVLCIDVDEKKIAQLQQGSSPIYEPGIEALLKRSLTAGRIQFSTKISDASKDCDLFMICVGTPPSAQGDANLNYVWQAAENICQVIENDCVVAIKSTVPVGTTRKLGLFLEDAIKARKKNIKTAVAFTPEFLKQGRALVDAQSPDRIVLGAEDPKVIELLETLYAPFQRKNDRTYVMSLESAEMTKYAANSMLASRISLMNELAQICDSYGADIESVREGIGADSRIGPAFLYAGIGYGGSCFPKDVKALIAMASSVGIEPYMLIAIDQRNEDQKSYLFRQIKKTLGSSLENKVFALWGLSFKPETDDLRDAPSLILIRHLLASGASVLAYDPIAIESAKKFMPEEWFSSGKVKIVDDQYKALVGADAMILVTEWKQFRTPDFTKMKELMRGNYIFDGRNQYKKKQVAKFGFNYLGVGRASFSSH